VKLLLLLAACNHATLDAGDVDLAGADFAVADLAVTNNIEVMTCCGGAPPQCFPAPDGGVCEPPAEPCTFPGSGCYVPCTAPPDYTVPLPAACAGDPDPCTCIMAHGGQDPCFPNGGDSCGPGISGHIQCLCY
jgi:hypothetical protein